MISAGEASGDVLGAALVTNLRRLAPGLSFSGLGGAAMNRAGVELLADSAQIAVTGLAELVPVAGQIFRTQRLLRRALIDCWAEPGFHRFWQVWNPGIGHLLFRLYLRLGGNRIWPLAMPAVFVVCGVGHDLAVMAIFRRPFLAFTAAFLLFGLMAALSRALAAVLHQERWPWFLNVGANVACLAIAIHAAVQLQMWVFP